MRTNMRAGWSPWLRAGWRALPLLRPKQPRAAERVVEQQWTRTPHPDLLAAYRRARPVAEPLHWVKQVERLARLAPLNRESMIALGIANLDAKLWGEARRDAVHLDLWDDYLERA